MAGASLLAPSLGISTKTGIDGGRQQAAALQIESSQKRQQASKLPHPIFQKCSGRPGLRSDHFPLSPRSARLWAVRGERPEEGGLLADWRVSRFVVLSMFLATNGHCLPPHPDPLGSCLLPFQGAQRKRRRLAAAHSRNVQTPGPALQRGDQWRPTIWNGLKSRPPRAKAWG